MSGPKQKIRIRVPPPAGVLKWQRHSARDNCNISVIAMVGGYRRPKDKDEVAWDEAPAIDCAQVVVDEPVDLIQIDKGARDWKTKLFELLWELRKVVMMFTKFKEM